MTDDAIRFTLNGSEVLVGRRSETTQPETTQPETTQPETTQPETTLLETLRHELGLAGPKFGCGLGQCGACMVLVNGRPEPSCATLTENVAGAVVVTVEGLSGDSGTLHPLQQAFVDERAGQCGFCLSGILISAAALLERNPDPSREAVLEALDGNLCRCGAHHRIVRAVLRAAGRAER